MRSRDRLRCQVVILVARGERLKHMKRLDLDTTVVYGGSSIINVDGGAETKHRHLFGAVSTDGDSRGILTIGGDVEVLCLLKIKSRLRCQVVNLFLRKH